MLALRTIFLTLFVGLLSGCGAPDEAVTAAAENLYERGRFEDSRAILSDHPKVNTFTANELRLQFLIKDSLKPGSDVGYSQLELALDKWQSHWEDNVDVSHYREYINYRFDKKIFLSWACPSHPLKDACDCRIKSAQDKLRTGAEWNFRKEIQAAEWFAEYIRKACVSPQATALHIAALADRDVTQAKRELASANSSHNVQENSELTRSFCRLKSLYVNFPEESGIAHLESAGDLVCR